MWPKPDPIPGFVEIQPKVRFYQDAKDPERIRMFVHWDGFTDQHGERPGMQLVFSANPKSADFNTNNFNRCYRALAAHAGVKVKSVKERSRLLRLRRKHIESYEIR